MTKGNEDFFVIRKEEVLESIPERAVQFYAAANYLDLKSGDLHIARQPLLVDSKVLETASSLEIRIPQKQDVLLDNISYDDGKSILKKLGLTLPSASLMYRIIIPHVKRHSKEDDGLRKVLEAMVNDYNEFLEDKIQEEPRFSRNLKICIGKLTDRLRLPCPKRSYYVQGKFDIQLLNEFGFPLILSENGEFHYFGPNDFIKPIGKELYPYGGGPKGEIIAIRQIGESLGLNLLFTRADVQDNLGVRGVKIE